MTLFNAHFFRTIAPFSETVIATLLMQTIPSTLNATYWLHFGLTVLSWFIPFLFDWRLVLCAYSIVLLQFVVFGGCLMNRGHALDDAENDHTFYAHLLENAGISVNRSKVKNFVRSWLYVVLGSVTVLWQVILGHNALLF